MIGGLKHVKQLDLYLYFMLRLIVILLSNLWLWNGVCVWFSPRHAGSFLLLTCSEIKLSGAMLHLFCLLSSTVTVCYLQIWAVTSFAGLDLSTQPLLQSFISSIWGYFQIQSELFYCYILAIIYLLWVCGHSISWHGAFSKSNIYLYFLIFSFWGKFHTIF